MLFVPAVLPPAPTSESAWCFAFVEGQILLPQDEGAALAPHRFATLEPLAERRHYLGQLEGIDCWALALAEPPTGWRRSPLRAAMMQFGEPLMGVAGRAAQVLEWDRAHRYCGVCGAPTEAQPGERSRKCTGCGHTAYPRLSPAMMVLVWREGQVLLARSPHYVPGVYSALAGFVEAGESLETGPNGRAGLSLPGIASARLDHDTRIRLDSADRLVIERGALYVDAGADASGNSHLAVQTPAGVVRHVGTQYEVRLDGSAVQLRVREGRVEWLSNSGARERGRAGEQLTIAADGAVKRVQSTPYGESWDWIASTTPAIDIEGRPLAEFLEWAGRELGRDIMFATPDVQREAASIVVHGSIAGLTPQQALDAVLATTSVRGTLDDGRIVIAGGGRGK
jgi:ferric-dicitrate binding protein FerR (iron transport regulator)